MKLAAAALMITGATSAAHAFEIETPVSKPCHEETTLAALQTSGFPAVAEAPTPTEEQRRAMADLVFALPGDDPWTLALFIGVRSNDLRDNAPTAVSALVHVHDDPADQPAHCMRRIEDDGPGGDVTAIAACRDFIVGELEAGGLLDDSLDVARTEMVSSYFRYRGKYEIALPSFAYRLGRAAHALQDGYTHSMRDAETGAVVHMLNWIEAYSDQDYAAEVDGHPHLAGLDECRNVKPHQQLRIDRATEATTKLFAAIADPAAGRRARVLAAVDEALQHLPGCTAANDYCNAPEMEEPVGPRTFGCSTTNGASALLLVGALGVLLRRRQHHAAAAAAVALTLWAAPSHAQPAPPAPTAPTDAPASRFTPEPQPDDPLPANVDGDWDADHFHFDARVGGSADNGGVGGMVGVGWTRRAWTFGVLGEWNPWFSLDRISARAGTFNAYGTAAYRWFKSNRLSISTRIEAGSSTMLFEVLGLDRFTTGVYLGGALASIRFPVNRGFAITFDPIHFALPTPRPFGLPFYHKQYRATVGIELRL